MTNAQHTPGPWDLYMVHAQNGDNHLTYRIEADGEHPRRIADLIRPDLSPNGHISYDAAVEEANARLIAAAPDLLEIIEAMNNCFQQGISCNFAPDCAMASKIRAAIAKATGN